MPWKGKSLQAVRPATHPWATPFEKSGLKRTPRYAETVAWLKRLADASPHVSLVSLGKSDEGRDVWMVVASREKEHTPVALRGSKRPTLLAQGGIHSGEIDGKDAGMMLLRDLTVVGNKSALLERANFLFIPILSVDGHERFSRFSRVNQRGPLEMGWRTNSRNLNLNRDYAKVDTPELRAALRAINEWGPDLYYDLHVTDGADYQYDVTWGYNGKHAHSPWIAGWLSQVLDPVLKGGLKAQGHIPGPLVFAVDPRDMRKGNSQPTFGPRYSHGYGDLRHLPSILVENHSLKPYVQRVAGTYVLLALTLAALGEHGNGLRRAVAADRARRPKRVTLTWKAPDGKPRTAPFLGIEQRLEEAPVSGGRRVVWTGKPVTFDVPVLERTVPDLQVPRPKAYWIPPAWREVIDRLQAHGIRFERIRKARTLEVEMDRVETYKLSRAPFEGHVRVTATFDRERRRETFAPGSVRVPTNQPLGDLAVHLLDPRGPDSFFQWGFFLEVLQRTEYVENYVMVPLAKRMLEKDPALKARYEKRLKEDEAFRKDPRARLRWLYARTPYFDQRWQLYPVGRE